MTMTKVEIDVPEEIVPYTVLEDKEAQITRNAMLVYPYIKNGAISHGKATEMLGLHKIDLITFYFISEIWAVGIVAETVWCSLYSKGCISGVDRE
ncbi:MAG: hypothetical protein NC089_05895 [Bacteroides sp.]|nr:hypothetical protein [Bacteroides sp.]MCM1548961.1 hypothetical protein [Clostridium sp.]